MGVLKVFLKCDKIAKYVWNGIEYAMSSYNGQNPLLLDRAYPFSV